MIKSNSTASNCLMGGLHIPWGCPQTWWSWGSQQWWKSHLMQCWLHCAGNQGVMGLESGKPQNYGIDLGRDDKQDEHLDMKKSNL